MINFLTQFVSYCDMKVVGVTSVGASVNRRMYRMHLRMTRAEDINEDVDVTDRTLNVMADEMRNVIFILYLMHRI